MADLKTSLCATDKEPLISKDCDLVVLCILRCLTDDTRVYCFIKLLLICLPMISNNHA